MKKLATSVVVLFAICFVLVAGIFVVRLKMHPVKHKEKIYTYALEYSLNPALVASLINTESSFKCDAVSNKNAIGLMQIKLTTARYMDDYYHTKATLDEDQLFDVDTNLNYGCMYLKYLFNKFENEYTAIASYNAGETIVRAWLNDEKYSTDGKTLTKIPYKETEDYIKKIKKNLKFYSKIFKI